MAFLFVKNRRVFLKSQPSTIYLKKSIICKTHLPSSFVNSQTVEFIVFTTVTDGYIKLFKLILKDTEANIAQLLDYSWMDKQALLQEWTVELTYLWKPTYVTFIMSVGYSESVDVLLYAQKEQCLK